ncbi:DUF429 domain-containing protein [Caldithrix abyssi]
MTAQMQAVEDIVGMGIDGCRGGWLVCRIKQNGRPEFKLQRSLADMPSLLTSGVDVFIDMPFGLSADQPRLCDSLARALLGKRASTIFPVPCRKAVYAASYAQACQINQTLCGKKLSIQAWNLTPKIRELDQLLITNPSLQNLFYESHPELCFRWLNDGRVLSSSKKTSVGQAERLHLLQKRARIDQPTLIRWRKRMGLSNAQPDDLLDALALAVCAAAPRKLRYFVPETPLYDAFGLRMNVVCLSNAEQNSGRVS